MASRRGLAVLALVLAAASPAQAAGRNDPALVASLPRDFRAADAEFNRRLRGRFPLGSPARALAETLAREGFRRDPATGDEQAASLRRDNLVCRIGAHVWWRADAQGRIASIRGRYGEEGCL